VLRTLGATDALASVTRTARDQWSILEHAVDEAERESVDITNDETRFNAWPENAWLRGALLQRHIRRLDNTARDFDAHRIANELDSIRRLSVTKSLELIRRDSALVLRKRPTATPEFEIQLTPNTAAFIPELARTVHVADSAGQPITDHRQPFQLPQTATPHFTIRNRRNGDRFQPLGLSSPKKLKDFLIDRKIPVEIRDRLPLLIWNGEIVWVAGVEISERFKITDSAGGIYEVWMEDSGAADHDDHSRLQR
jgi:tRNA(Ile)-lysidine synthetase-like protein